MTTLSTIFAILATLLSQLSGLTQEVSRISQLAQVSAPPAISLLSHTQSTNGISPAINTTGATLIVVQEVRYGLAPTAPTDSAGNTWTALPDHSNSTSYHIRYYYICGPTTNSNHIFTPGAYTTGSAVWMSVAAFSGTAASDCHDAGTNQGAKSNSITTALPAITPSQSGDLIISGAAQNTGGADGTFAVNQGLSIAESKTSGPVAALAWKQHTSASPLSVSWTVGNSFDTQMAVVAFKAASSESTPTPPPPATPTPTPAPTTPSVPVSVPLPTPIPAPTPTQTSTPISPGMGWTDLGAGSRLSLSSPQNCNNTSSPAYCNGIIYSYADHFPAIMTAWGNAIARTKAGSEQLVFIGDGGHNDYLGNDVHSINLYTNPVSVSMLTTPSIPYGSGSPVTVSNITCKSPNPDGTPMSQHGYQNSVYLPKHDEAFFWGQGQSGWCLSNWAPGSDRLTWTFRFSDNTWHNMNPGGFNVKAGYDGSFASYVVLDPTTADETVLVVWGLGSGPGELLRYNRDTNVWSQLLPYGSYAWPSGATAAVDPVRKLLVIFGASRYDGAGGLKAIKVNIANSSYQVTDMSSSLSGCNAANVLNPGMVYDPTTGNFKVYPGSGNSVLDFNPATGVCTTQTASGGPTDPLPGAGHWGKWQYFPTLNGFVNATKVSSNAFIWKASGGGSTPSSNTNTPTVPVQVPITPQPLPVQPPPSSGSTNGLGGSTYTCIDLEGDGYGTGAGCLGPDADDSDATVHTGPQAITKWGTLTAFLSHLGYNPLRVWYISPTGNDATCKLNGAPVGIGSPCLNATPVLTSLRAGDMVIYRAGTYTAPAQFFYPVTNGTQANPIIVMTYPGESVTIDTSVNSNPAISLLDRSWYIIDGFKITKGFNGGCISGGTSQWLASTNTYHDVTVRHVEMYNCKWGYIAAGGDNLLLEDSIGHDNPYEHAVYWGAKGDLVANNNTIRRTIAYNNAQNGYHLNGNMNHLVMENNIAYNNGIANFDWQNGIHNSVFRSNLSFQGGSSGGLILSTYPGTEGTNGCGPSRTEPCVCNPGNMYSICAHDMENNLIENFTSYQGQYVYDGTNAGQVAVWVARQNSCTTSACLAASMGNNTFRNIIAVTHTNGSNHYQPIIFGQSAYFSTSKFENIISWQSDPAHKNGVVGVGFYPSSYGFQPYTCASWASTFGNITGPCINADPKFVAANSGWYKTPGLFDLRLQSTSPAISAGTPVGAPTYDLLGNTFNNPPSIGAYEYNSKGVAFVNQNSTPIPSPIPFSSPTNQPANQPVSQPSSTPNPPTPSTPSPSITTQSNSQSTSQPGASSATASISSTTNTQSIITSPTLSSSCTTAPSTTLTRNLSRSTKGDDVKTLQTFLIAQGHLPATSQGSSNATGFFGPLTEQAVQSFQRTEGIVSSGSFYTSGYGNVGPTTRAKINVKLTTSGTVACATPSIDALKAQIQMLQKQVEALLLKLQQIHR